MNRAWTDETEQLVATVMVTSDHDVWEDWKPAAITIRRARVVLAALDKAGLLAKERSPLELDDEAEAYYDRLAAADLAAHPHAEPSVTP